jgi:hypothetical protein
MVLTIHSDWHDVVSTDFSIPLGGGFESPNLPHSMTKI